jgi:uncharacterized protein
MESFDYKKFTWVAGMLALVGIFFASLAFGASEWQAIDHPNGQQATITVSGEGEVQAVPDIATVTITVRESAKTVPEAQTLVEAKVVAAINSLANLGVEEKDRKTENYNVTPKYEYYSNGGYASNPRIVGYEASQTVRIKVRNVAVAGDVIGALGGANITEISGPTFTVDEPDELQAQAKEDAIEDARAKARATAKALGMRLGEVIQFSEDTGGYYPYARDMVANQSAAYGKGGALGPEVTLPTGENTITSRVTITYTLR